MAARFWVGGTGTWDNSDTTHWSATTGGAGGVSVPASGDTVTFDGSSGGGTVTVAATINGSNTITSLTCGAFTGTLDFSANDPSLTMGTFSGTGTGTRTINMGDGTFTLTATFGTVWDFGTITNLTFNCNGSTIVISATAINSRTFSSGNLTYNAVTLVRTGVGSYTTGFNGGSSTIGTLNVTAPNNVSFGNNCTITNAFNPQGTSASNVILINNGSSASTVTLTNGGTMEWVAVGNLTFTGSPTATNSFNLGGTSGITISGPSGGGVIGVIGS